MTRLPGYVFQVGSNRLNPRLKPSQTGNASRISDVRTAASPILFCSRFRPVRRLRLTLQYLQTKILQDLLSELHER